MQKTSLMFCALFSMSVLSLSALAQDTSDVTFKFETVNYPGDNFTQLLGINKDNAIAGYHGSGADAKHPNKGFVLTLPNHFAPENFPGSVQTQVIGINDSGDTDGFYIDKGGINHGFLEVGSKFITRDFPDTTFNQLLGINNLLQVAGFYNDSKNISHAVVWDLYGGVYQVLEDGHAPGGMTETGINNSGWTSGFYVDAGGLNHGFLLANGKLTTLDAPDSTSTQAFGLNDKGEVVGTYTDKGGLIHGFIYKSGKFQPVDDPKGVGATIINGVNNAGWIVGFYGPCVNVSPTSTPCNGFVGTPE
ncbi:MAG: hypothetical protein JOY62_13140 [Acidobacteriaceae bacterium]|nr:hypothetical protein [Acidobacteriaceae bacterium]MBV9780906.1 hypothetical protein [Acidobacteriaceae bacterium]